MNKLELIQKLNNPNSPKTLTISDFEKIIKSPNPQEIFNCDMNVLKRELSVFGVMILLLKEKSLNSSENFKLLLEKIDKKPDLLTQVAEKFPDGLERMPIGVAIVCGKTEIVNSLLEKNQIY